MDAFAGVSTVAVRGDELAYREVGEGDAVVLVHGTLSDMRTWEHQLPALGSSFRTIAYSRRYSPPNRAIPDGDDDPMPAHVDDLIALLGAIDAEPAYLVGDSWGGFVALLTAMRRPDLVRGLVLQEPPVLTLFTSARPRPQEVARLLIRRPRTAAAILRFGGGAIAPTERLLRRGENERAMERFARGTLGPAVFMGFPEARRQQARENIPTLRAQLLGAGFPPLEDGQVRGVEAPTLLVTGELSRPFFRHLVARLDELLPNARQVEIRGASHSMHEQEPAEVNEAILGFLRSLDRG